MSTSVREARGCAPGAAVESVGIVELGGRPLWVAARSHPEAAAAEARLIGHELLRMLAARLLGSATDPAATGAPHPASLRVVQSCPDCGGPHGRPVLYAGEDPLRLGASVSHARGLTVAVVAAGASVGIDAERVDDGTARARDLDRLLAVASDPLLDWNRREAVLKADGRGLRVDPALISIERDEYATIGGGAADLTNARYATCGLALGPEYSAALAVRTDGERRPPQATTSPAAAAGSP